MAITVLDGGFSTQLALHVTDPIDGDPLWSARFLATDPHAVYQTHLDYFRAGAEIVITNSYQASIDGFQKYLGLDKVASLDLIRESVRLAHKARNHFIQENCSVSAKRPLIAGSVGSYGASLHDGSEYTGRFIQNVTREELREWHRPRFQALLEAQVDLLALETIPVLEEAQALLDLLDEFPKARAWLSFQCKDGTHIASGEKFGDVVAKCWNRNPHQLLGIGCNCLDPMFISQLLRNARNTCKVNVPFVVYPNSGEQYSPKTGWSGKETRADLTDLIGEWLTLGVKFVGGCCRTDANDVTVICKCVNKWLIQNKCCC